VYINRFLVALVFSIFFGSGTTLAGVEEDYAIAKQSFDSGDYKTAMAAWAPLGEEGHSGSQVMLGYAYKNGMGVVKNKKPLLSGMPKLPRREILMLNSK
jgi:TPR repeat protein